MSKQTDLLQKRDSFSGSVGFILASIGSAVGVGNIWRFPTLVSQYGGLTFMIPYLFFVVLIASTGVMEEYAFGRVSKAGPVGAFGWACEQKGHEKLGRALGNVPVFGMYAFAFGYTVILGWMIQYMFMSVTGELTALGTELSTVYNRFNEVSSAGGANIGIIVSVVILMVIMTAGVGEGIEKANKILMPILFGLFLAIGIYIATLSGSEDGYTYILTLNPEGLLNPKLWIYAFGQAFFSLSVSGASSVIYGSYLDKKESIPFCALNVALFDTVAALLAACVIIPAMAVSGSRLSEGGPGLMFVYLVNVFNGMKGGRIIAFLFFLCATFAGMTSIIAITEPMVEYLQKTLKWKRGVAVAVALGGCCVAALLIQPITSQWMDVASIYICPFGAMLAGIMFFWVAKKESVWPEINLNAKRPLDNAFYAIGKFVYVPLTLVALVAGAVFGGIG